MKTLSIIECAFRATLEEQDDTIVWITHALCNAGAEQSVLLRGSAVACAVVAQDAGGLEFGDVRQVHPPDLAGDIARLMQRGLEVYYVEDDASLRGITPSALLPGLRPIGRGDLPELFEQFQRIWHW